MAQTLLEKLFLRSQPVDTRQTTHGIQPIVLSFLLAEQFRLLRKRGPGYHYRFPLASGDWLGIGPVPSEVAGSSPVGSATYLN